MTKLLSFSFAGRSDRLEFWRVQVLTLILSGVAALVSLTAMPFVGSIAGVLFLANLPLYWLAVAVGVRRLHDRGRSGWWYLLFVLIPLGCSSAAGALLSYSAPMNSLFSLAFSLPGLIVGLWGLVEIGFLRGEGRSNRYGDEILRGGARPDPNPQTAASN